MQIRVAAIIYTQQKKSIFRLKFMKIVPKELQSYSISKTYPNYPYFVILYVTWHVWLKTIIDYAKHFTKCYFLI